MCAVNNSEVYRVENPGRLNNKCLRIRATFAWVAALLLSIFSPAGLGDDSLLVHGRVLDDHSGIPLEAAAVGFRIDHSEPAEAETIRTDGSGRYVLDVPRAATTLQVLAPGHTEVFRPLTDSASATLRIADARLTRRVAVPAFDVRVGTRFALNNSGGEVSVAPGAFDDPVILSATPLSRQALPLPLPPGWSPVWAFELHSDAAQLNTPFEIHFSEALGKGLVPVWFDRTQLAWRPLQTVDDADRPVFTLARLSTVALASPDVLPRPPPSPETGLALQGVEPVGVPDALQAEFTTMPAALFLQEAGTADVRVRVIGDGDLPSGTVILVEQRDVFRYGDGSQYLRESQLRDLWLFRSDEGLTGSYTLSAQAHGADGLVDGAVTLHARHPELLRGSVRVGPAGVALPPAGRFSLQIPGGAVTTALPATLWSVSDPPALPRQDYVALGGFALDLHGAQLAHAAELTIRDPPARGEGETLLLFKTIHDQQRSFYQLVALPGQRQRERALGLPGIRTGGQYTLVQSRSPYGFARIRLLASESTQDGALVRLQGGPVAQTVADIADTAIIPVPLGEHHLSARDHRSGLAADTPVTLSNAGQVVDVDMTLQRMPLRVADVSPRDGSVDVSTGAVIVIQLTNPLDTDAFDSHSVRLYQGDDPVAAEVELQRDARSVLVRPTRLLQEVTAYRLELDAGIADDHDNRLQGNQADGGFVARFTTQDNTPPEPPAAGMIVAGTPDEKGKARISGSQGTVEPGILVTVRNTRTGVTVSTQADDNGSFVLSIVAGLIDDLEMVLLDEGGNEQVLDIGRVTPPPGTAVLDAGGGPIEGEKVTRALIPKGLLGPDTIVRARPIDTRGMANPFSRDMPGFIAGAMEFDLSGFEVADLLEMELSVDRYPDFTTRDRIPLFRIDRELVVPSDLQAGERLTVRLSARDQARQTATISAEIEIVSQVSQVEAQVQVFDGAPSLQLQLPRQAVPGQSIQVHARGDPPNIKFRFPASPILTGDEQFLLFAVREVDGKPFWDLADKAGLKTLDDGSRVIETASPPYRGIRKDTSQLVMAVFASGSLAFVQAINGSMLTSDLTHNFIKDAGSKGLKGAVGADKGLREGWKGVKETGTGIANAFSGSFRGFEGLHALGTSIQALTSWPDRNPHEFSVIPVPAGVPAQINVVDQDTNTRLHAMDIPALPPGTLSEVLVLGEDDNDLQVTGVVSPANYAVPLEATLAVSFSHLIEPSSITEASFKIIDSAGNPIPARRDTQLDPERGFLATITPEHPLATDTRYKLVATRAIRRAGRDPDQGEGLQQDFEFSFTSGGALELAGQVDLPWAKSFDAADDILLVSQREPGQGVNSFVTIDTRDVSKPTVLKRTPLPLDRYGPIWSVRLMPDVDFTGRNEKAVKGDLALVSAGNSGTFSSIQIYDINQPDQPQFRSNTLVSLPLDVLQDTAKLLVMPTLSSRMKSEDMQVSVTDPTASARSVRQFIGSLDLSWEVRDYFTANIDGIPKTTAYPWKVITDTDHTAYFINQGIGLMTIDLRKAIPQGTPATRGERFGPSYIPKDKVGAIIVRDDASLRTSSTQFAITSPAHPAKVDERVQVTGLIRDARVASIHVNGFKANVERADDGQGRNFSLPDLPLKDGVNELRATAFAANGEELDSISQLVLRDYASNPLAGPGSVTLNLPGLSVTSAASVTAVAGVRNAGELDELWINGRLVAHCGSTAKHMRRTASDRAAHQGLACEGSAEIPLEPGINTIVATAINLDEEFPKPYSAADLWLEEGLLLAVKNDLDIFDSSGLVKIRHVPVGPGGQAGKAMRVSVARGVMVDIDDDGKHGIEENDDGDDITLFDEFRSLALLGEVAARRLTFVDITEPHKARVFGRIPTDHAVYSAVSLPDEGIAYVAAGEALLTIDLTRANHDGLLDRDGDGRDDRILSSLPVKGGGAQDIRIDIDKGLVYVLQRDQGVLIYRRANACSRDYGVDVTYTPVPREVRFATQDQEKLRLLRGLLEGMQSEHCAGQGFELNRNTALLSQGSSACIWSDDGQCSSAYQPGLSDYDFELIVPADRIDAAKDCAVAMEDAIHRQPGLETADVTVFPIRDTGLQYAYRDVRPVTGNTCGGGDDPYGDLCLGRNGNILRWALEGEWVSAGDKVFNNDFDLNAVLRTLQRPIYPPVDGKTDQYSERVDPHSGQKVAILDQGGTAEPTHVPRLEGLEWACLQDFALNQSGARIRIKGVGLGDVPIQSPDYLKKLHKVAKAGIRTVYGLLLSSDTGNRHMLDSDRAEYRSDRGCLTRTDEPEVVDSLDDFALKRCEGFTEYIASRALLSAKLGLVDAEGNRLLTDEQALLAYRMYRFKADVGAQLADEEKANRFIIDVLQFIDQVNGHERVNAVHEKTVGHFTDGDERKQRLALCEDVYLPKYKPERGGDALRLKIPARLYNSSYERTRDINLAFYHDDNELARVSCDLQPGESHFLTRKGKLPKACIDLDPQAGQVDSEEGRKALLKQSLFEIQPEFDGIHRVQFLADPDERFSEYDKANNYDGFYYYLIGRNSDPKPLRTEDVRPPPPKELPDPPASAACLIEERAPPSPRLQLIALADSQYQTAVAPGGDVELSWIVRNTGNEDLSGLFVEDSRLGRIDVPDLAAGKDKVMEQKLTVPDDRNKPVLGVSTVRGVDTDENTVGPVSSLVKVNVVSPARGNPVVRIYSPPKQEPPFETQADSMPVWGYVESNEPLAWIKVGDTQVKPAREADGLYRFETASAGQYVQLPADASTRIVVTAQTRSGARGSDEVEVIRVQPPKPGPGQSDTVLRISKRVKGTDLNVWHERIKARPGDQLDYRIVIVNDGPSDLTQVTLSDLDLIQPFEQGGGGNGPLYALDLPPTAPFDLAAGASEQKDLVYRLPDDAGGGRIANRAYVAGIDSARRPVAASDQAEVLIDAPPVEGDKNGGLALDPGIVLLRKPSGDPKKPTRPEHVTVQLKVTRLADGVDVSRSSRTRFQDLGQILSPAAVFGEMPGPVNPVLQAIWDEIKSYLTKRIETSFDEKTKQATGGLVTPKVPAVAKVEFGPDGKMTASGEGITIIRAVHKSPRGELVYSNYALVIVGIGYIESIDIQPRSFASFGPQAGQYLTNLLAQKIVGDDEYRLLEADIPMFLAPPMTDLTLWQKYVTDNGSYLANWLGSTGFAELTSVKLDFMGGAISGLDILEAARKLLKMIPPVTVVLPPPAPPVPVRIPVGWFLAQLVGPAATQMVDFEAEGGAVSVRSSFPKGFVSALQPGLSRVTGTLDFSASGFGSAKDDFLAFVGPKLLSTELRPVEAMDYPRLARGSTEADVLLAGQRKGTATLDLEVWEPGRPAPSAPGKKIKALQLKVKVVDPPADPADALPPIVVDPDRATEVVVPQGGPRRLRIKLLPKAAVRDYEVHVASRDRSTVAWARASEITVRANRTAKLLTFARIGQEQSEPVAGQDGDENKPVGVSLPSNADLVNYVGGGRMDSYLQSLLPQLSPELIAKYREKGVQAVVPGCAFSGDLALPLVADQPSDGLGNVSLDMTIGFAAGTDDDGALSCELLLKSYALGFPAPNLFNEHQFDASLFGTGYLLDDHGKKNDSIAGFVDNKGTALRVADLFSWMPFGGFGLNPSDAYTGLTFEREIRGRKPGQVHAGVETGAFFLGDRRADTYLPNKGMGGLTVTVTEADETRRKPPRCENQVYATWLSSALDIRLQGASRSRGEADGMARLDVNIVEQPSSGELTGGKRKDRGAFTFTYKPSSTGIDTFRYRVVEGELESEVCSVRVLTVKLPKIKIPGIDLELPQPFCLPTYIATEKNKPVDVTLLGFTLRTKVPGLPFTDLTFDEYKPQGVMLKGLLDYFGYDKAQPLPLKGEVEGFSRTSRIGITSVRYVPDKDTFGLDMFFYKVNDGRKDSHYCPVVVDVFDTPVDEPPTAISKTHECTAQNTPVTSRFHGTDPEGRRLDIELAPGGMPTHGRIIEMGPIKHSFKHSRRDFTYLPDKDHHGADNVVFIVTDPEDNLDAGYIGFKINQAPVCTEISDKIPIDADEVRVLPIFMADPDDCGKPLEPKVRRMPTKGVITAVGKDSISYRPFKTVTAGTDSFAYAADDGLNLSEPCEVSVVIEPNEPPKAIGRSMVVQKNSRHTDPRNRTTLQGDDEPTQQLTFQFPPISNRGGQVRGAQRVSAHAMLATYAPPPDYAGIDGFRFIADDGKKKSSPASVHIRVNAPPIARDDHATTNEDIPVVVDVLANDHDPDGRKVRLDTFDTVAFGADGIAVADISRDGDALRIAPRPRYFGQFSFNYRILDSDDAPAEQSGLVTVTVVHVNHPPVAQADRVATDEDVPIAIDVMANDSDPDEGDELYIDRVTRARHGRVTNQGGAILYEPEANWSGKDGFRYTIRDQDGEEASADVDITVNAVNDPPLIPDQKIFVWCCNPETLDVLKEATDPDSKIDYPSLTIVKPPHKGKAEVRPKQGDIRYTPNLAYRGKTELRVTVADKEGAVSNPASITVTIGAIHGMVNEIVPAESRIELFNPDAGSIDLTGWSIAGYTIGSNPAQEAYSRPPGDPQVKPASRFASHSYLVLTLPGTDLRFGRIELRDETGRLRELIEPDLTCYERSGGKRALARRWDGFAAFNSCLEFRWLGKTTLGGKN